MLWGLAGRQTDPCPSPPPRRLRLLGLQRQRLGAEAAARRLEELAAEPAPRLSREEEALLVRRLYDERLLEQQHERQRMEQKHRPRVWGHSHSFLFRMLFVHFLQ